jgi:dihydroorotate dehydrogenase electron transfer subunit
MIVDVDAAVMANTRLSSEYNVLALAAPDIAASAQPGQFVMVKASRGTDPLLRRPFSIFEILRDDGGTPTGISLLNKRIGAGTGLVFDLAAGDRIACLGPLGRPFQAVDPPVEAWMVAGGVGLAPFATLAESLRARGTRTTLFYGGRRDADLFSLPLFETLGVRLVLATEDGSRGERGRVTAPLERELRGSSNRTAVAIYACGPEAMLAAVAALAARYERPSQVSVERVMGCGLGGCYSCVIAIRGEGGTSRYVRSCIEGPVFRGEDILWE